MGRFVLLRGQSEHANLEWEKDVFWGTYALDHPHFAGLNYFKLVNLADKSHKTKISKSCTNNLCSIDNSDLLSFTDCPVAVATNETPCFAQNNDDPLNPYNDLLNHQKRCHPSQKYVYHYLLTAKQIEANGSSEYLQS